MKPSYLIILLLLNFCWASIYSAYKVQGTIEEIAYFGTHSVYHVRLKTGKKLLVHFMNAKRWASERFTWNDQVWLSWGDLAGVVLTS